MFKSVQGKTPSVFVGIECKHFYDESELKHDDAVTKLKSFVKHVEANTTKDENGFIFHYVLLVTGAATNLQADAVLAGALKEATTCSFPLKVHVVQDEGELMTLLTPPLYHLVPDPWDVLPEAEQVQPRKLPGKSTF